MRPRWLLVLNSRQPPREPGLNAATPVTPATLFRMPELSSISPTDVRVSLTTSAGASEKILLELEAALTHSRFTEVVEATGWPRPRRTAS